MRGLRTGGAVAAMMLSLILWGCADDPTGLFAAGPEPASISLKFDRSETFEGESATALIELRDATGQPIRQIPHWVEPMWSMPGWLDHPSDDGQLATPTPGIGFVIVRVGQLRASAQLRVNAKAVTLRVDGVHMNQAVQRYDGSVPLVQNRAGILRVFVTALEPNRIAPPPATIELFLDGARVHSETVTAITSDIPFAPEEGSLSHSWNVTVPAALAQPGLAVRVEVDPDRTVPRRDDSGPIHFPASGEPLPLEIHPVPEFRVRFVPIHQSRFGSTGDVGEHNVDAYLTDLVAAFPIDAVDYDYRVPFTSDLAEQGGTDWVGILFQLRAVRAAEAHDDRYYYGVLTRHNTAVAGIAFVPGRTSLGADFFPFGTLVFVHELGHNFGRFHAPCGLSQYDLNYPHEGGAIGHYGWDPRTGRLISSSIPDLMGYCQPYWVSDYTYEAVFDYRHAFDQLRTEAPSPRNTLVVWGGVRDGVPSLEPAFESVAVPSPPTDGGPYRLEGFDRDGARLFSYAFMPERISHAAGHDAHGFAYALPADRIGLERLDRIRVLGPGGQDEMRMLGAPPGAWPGPPGRGLEARVARTGDGVVVRWDTSRGRMAVVRDRATGRIIALDRRGEIRLPPGVEEVDVDVSGGVRSARVPVIPE